jgi:hypothetical protein
VSRVARVAFLALSVALAGCGSAETKDDKPISHSMASDPPPSDGKTAPPLSRPREKIAPPVTLNSQTSDLLTPGEEQPLH